MRPGRWTSALRGRRRRARRASRRRGRRAGHPDAASRRPPATAALLRLGLAGSESRIHLAQDAPGRVAITEEIADLHRHARLVLADFLDGGDERRTVLRLGIEA